MRLDERVLRWAALQPQTPALWHDGRACSWRELLALVDRQDVMLAEAGIGPGAALGWLGHNSPQMLAALLACARRGAVFVPLNWRLSVVELAEIAQDAGLKALLGTPELEQLAAQVRSLGLGGAPGAFEEGDLMLVYTSGTTGRPRGAIHTHAGMLANIDAAIEVQGLHEGTRALAVLPMFHVGGLCIQLLPTLAAGGQVCLHPRFDAAAWLRDAAAWRATTSLLVPTTMRALLEHPDWAATPLASLEFVNTGSTIVPVALIEAFHRRGVPVAQVYGATETGPVSIALRPEHARSHVGSVGRPARGVQVKLVDGEVWLRGANLMRGYHREPPLGDAWLPMGDLAEVAEDGFYRIVGRCKDLIISGGENVYPAEIEHLLEGDDEVAEAAAVGLPDERWGEVPVLAVVARSQRRIDLDRLRALFAARLARYKQPRDIIVLDALPKSALGKVQKAALAQRLQETAARRN